MAALQKCVSRRAIRSRPGRCLPCWNDRSNLIRLNRSETSTDAFAAAAMPTTEGRVENALVLDAVLAGAGERACRFHGGGEAIEHVAVRVNIGYFFLGHRRARCLVDDGHRAVYAQTAFCSEDAVLADDLHECAVDGAKTDLNVGQRSAA